MRTRFFSLLSVMLVLLLSSVGALRPLVAAAQTATSANGQVGAQTGPTIYLPLINKGCGATGETYGTINMIPPVADHVDYKHADLNLDLRSYITTSDTPLGLKAIQGDTASTAPQLETLFSPSRIPTFVQNYRIGNWNWAVPPDGAPDGTYQTDPPVTLSGFSVSTIEKIYVPAATNPPIGVNPVYNVAVLYATFKQITFIYTAQDTVTSGYTIHIDNICVDPNLVSLYQSLNATGRDYLPALRNGQAIGYPRSNQIVVSIVDRGTTTDPRSCKDWWKSHWNGRTDFGVACLP